MDIKNKFIWLAGLYEGEGSIDVKHNRVTIALHERDEDVIQKIVDFFGGTIQRRHSNPNVTSMLAWRTTNSKDTYAIIVGMFPFLGKRRQGQLTVWLEKFKTLAKRQPSKSRLKF